MVRVMPQSPQCVWQVTVQLNVQALVAVRMPPTTPSSRAPDRWRIVSRPSASVRFCSVCLFVIFFIVVNSRGQALDSVQLEVQAIPFESH